MHFQYGSKDLAPLFALEDRLESAIAASNVGYLDGDEIANDGSDGFIYMYGPDADRLSDVVLPVLKAADFMKGAEVTREYRPPAEKPREVVTKITG